MTDYNGKDNILTSLTGSQDGSLGTQATFQTYTATPGIIPGVIPEGLGTGSLVYYKMRALKDPFGSGFVGWVVTLQPDPNGDQAPEAIVPGSAVIMATWTG